MAGDIDQIDGLLEHFGDDLQLSSEINFLDVMDEDFRISNNLDYSNLEDIFPPRRGFGTSNRGQPHMDIQESNYECSFTSEYLEPLSGNTSSLPIDPDSPPQLVPPNPNSPFEYCPVPKENNFLPSLNGSTNEMSVTGNSIKHEGDPQLLESQILDMLLKENKVRDLLVEIQKTREEERKAKEMKNMKLLLQELLGANTHSVGDTLSRLLQTIRTRKNGKRSSKSISGGAPQDKFHQAPPPENRTMLKGESLHQLLTTDISQRQCSEQFRIMPSNVPAGNVNNLGGQMFSYGVPSPSVVSSSSNHLPLKNDMVLLSSPQFLSSGRLPVITSQNETTEMKPNITYSMDTHSSSFVAVESLNDSVCHIPITQNIEGVRVLDMPGDMTGVKYKKIDLTNSTLHNVNTTVCSQTGFKQEEVKGPTSFHKGDVRFITPFTPELSGEVKLGEPLVKQAGESQIGLLPTYQLLQTQILHPTVSHSQVGPSSSSFASPTSECSAGVEGLLRVSSNNSGNLTASSIHNSSVPLKATPVLVTSSSLVVNSLSANAQSEGKEKLLLPRLATPVCTSMPLRPVRRSSHNVIEKRYRRSINDRILALKELLVGVDSKLHKSGILQKAIDRINFLQRRYSKAIRDKLILQDALKRHGLTADVLAANHETLDAATVLKEDVKMEQMEVDSEEEKAESNCNYKLEFDEIDLEFPIDDSGYGSSGASSGLSPESSQVQQPADSGRVFLLMGIFALLYINPIGWLLGIHSLFAGQMMDGSLLHSSSRNLLSLNEPSMLRSWFFWAGKLLVVCVLNALIFGLVGFWLFVWSEVCTVKGTSLSAVRKLGAKTVALLRKGESSLAANCGIMTLRTAGRVPPGEAFISIFTGVVWQAAVHLSHLFGTDKLCRSLLRHIRYSDVSLDEDDSNTGGWAVWETGKIYFLLSEMSLHPDSGLTEWQGFHASLAAVNIGRLSHAPPGVMARIYLAACVHSKMTLPRFFSFIARYWFRKATSSLMDVNGSVPASLGFILLSEGEDFILRGNNWVLRPSEFNECFVAASCHSFLFSKPRESFLLSRLFMTSSELLRAQFREYLLHNVVSNLHSGAFRARAQPDVFSDQLEILQILRDACRGDEMSRDSCCDWWSSFLALIYAKKLSCHYSQDIVKIYNRLEHLPKDLQDSIDPLGRAACLCAKAGYLAHQLFNAPSSSGFDSNVCNDDEVCSHIEVLKLCNASSILLKESCGNPILKNHASPRTEFIRQCLQLALSENLLEIRLQLWQHGICGSSNLSDREVRRHVYRTDRSLNALRSDIDVFDELSCQIAAKNSDKTTFFEAFLRIVAGANPMQTVSLLETSLHSPLLSDGANEAQRDDGSNDFGKAITKTNARLEDSQETDCSTLSPSEKAHLFVLALQLPPRLLQLSFKRRKELLSRASFLMQKCASSGVLRACLHNLHCEIS